MKKHPVINNKNEFRELLFNQLLDITNIELLILKGHILAEYSLNKFIESFSHFDIIAAEEMRFTFSQKIQVCKILGLFFNNEDDVLEQLYLLNKMRNQIAHSLTFDSQLLQKLLDFPIDDLDEYKKAGEAEKGKIELYRMMSTLTLLCGRIMGRIDGKLKFEKTKKDLMGSHQKEKGKSND